MMILEKLWRGDVAPGERRYHPNKEYSQHLSRMEKYENIVKSELSEEGKLAFDEFADASLSFGVVGEGDNFIEGFRMGVMVMLDVFYPNRNHKEAAL